MDLQHIPSTHHCARSAGFTLLELMITLAIAAILLTLVAPSFAQIIASTRITTAINELVPTIHLLRSEAIKRGVRTVLCPSSDGVNCINAPEWENGWIAFTDEDSDRELDTTETILQIHNGVESSVTIRSGGRTRIVFKPSGILLGGFNGTYTFCDAGNAAPPKALILSPTGRPRLSQTRSDGTPLACP